MNKLTINSENHKTEISFNDHFANLVKINKSLGNGAREAYVKRGNIYVDVPEIVGITGACENVDTLFKVGNRLHIPLFFSQTGQLALEQALQSFSSVWTIIHSGRDEEIEDARHLRQFRLTEEEFDATTVGMSREQYDEDKMYEMLLENIQKTIQSMVKHILEDNGEILKKVYKRNIALLDFATKNDFLRISYEDAISLLNKNGFERVKFGDDLKSDHEAKIVELLNKKNKTELPVFIMKYPKEIKFFNMKVSAADPRVCLSADLIFPYAGEGTGSAVREHEFERLNERLITSTMYKLHVERGGKYEDFKWYLDIMKTESTQPHAGYGIGNDRVMQYVFGEFDIRNVSVFSLLNRQTGDWDKKRYGQAGFIQKKKKHVFLSIGQMKNKKALLPIIKKASHDDLVFYTTENTYNFLKENRVMTSMVYKISDIIKTPNVSDLLQRHVFDTIICIPTNPDRNKSEMSDGKIIRRAAVQLGLTPITSVDVAEMVLENLGKNE